MVGEVQKYMISLFGKRGRGVQPEKRGRVPPKIHDESGDFAICRFDAAAAYGKNNHHNDGNNPDIAETYMIIPAENRTIQITGKKQIPQALRASAPQVYITRDGRYLVTEPPLSRNAEQTYRRLMRNIHHSFTYQNISASDVIPLLKRTLEQESRDTDDFEVWRREKEAIEYYMVRDVAGCSEIDVLLRDPHIEDILCIKWDSPAAVVHREYTHHTLLDTNIVFRSESDMGRLIQRISQRHGEPPSETRPMTSFSDDNGIRYTFTGNRRITPDSPTMSIRKPSVSAITIYHLLKTGVISTLAAAYLWCVMDLKGFGLVIGAPSAGKTTIINSIFTMANPNWHYYTIEDVLELRLPHRHVSRHQTTRNSSLHGEAAADTIGNFSVFDLCKLSLRFRPDFVLVGEILGSEAEGLFQAAASGSGCMCSFHASNAEHAITRLEAPPISLSASQTALLTYVLHMSWVLHENKRQRKLLSITEVNANADDKSTTDAKSLDMIFRYDQKQNRLMPDDVDDVIRQSSKLRDMSVMLGVADIRQNMRGRMQVLQSILDEDITEAAGIHHVINAYYQKNYAKVQ